MAESGTDVPRIGIEDFLKVDIRVGTIVGVRPNTAARKPSFRVEVDFGPELGVKTSSAQLVELYEAAGLVGRQVAAVVNFPPRQVAKVVSEVLILGFPDEQGRVVLIAPERAVPNGGRLY
jgi:tRNA-binding protein